MIFLYIFINISSLETKPFSFLPSPSTFGYFRFTGDLEISYNVNGKPIQKTLGILTKIYHAYTDFSRHVTT